jgi:Tol biopolymer transport system component
MPFRRVAVATLTVGVGALLVACAQTKPTVVKQYEIREESTAIINLSVVSPDNLYVSNTPSVADERNLVYTARQWVDGTLPNTASIWRSPVVGGAATKLVAAGEGEWLVMARTAPRSNNVYYALNGSIYSTSKSGAGGRRKYPGTGYHDYAPVPFPDESRFLFGSCTLGVDCYYQDSNYIWMMNPDGTNMTQLRQGRDAQVSPDGKLIAFSYKGDIWSMRIDGTEATNLTASEDNFDSQPAWAPDGQRIYFTRVQSRASVKNTDVWMMRFDGAEVVQLTMNPSEDYAPFAAPDGYVYFISNRGALMKNQYPARIWRAQVVGTAADIVPGKPPPKGGKPVVGPPPSGADEPPTAR